MKNIIITLLITGGSFSVQYAQDVEQALALIEKHHCMPLTAPTEVSPAGNEYAEYSTIANTMNKLDISKARELINHTNPIVQLYAFQAFMNRGEEELYQAHLRMLEAKGKVSICPTAKTEAKSFPVSAIADKIYHRNAKVHVEVQDEILKERIKGKVEEYIREHAKYPSSYKSESFDKFYVNQPDYPVNGQAASFTVEHSYELMDKQGYERMNESEKFYLTEDLTLIPLDPWQYLYE
jgi:hypothetical protein